MARWPRPPRRCGGTAPPPVARAALPGAVYAPVGLATHYHTCRSIPYWADSLETVGTIGAHRFYRWRGAAGARCAFSDAYLGGEPAARPRAAPRRCRVRPRPNPLRSARAYEQGVVAARGRVGP
jgi:hypothetical protein